MTLQIRRKPRLTLGLGDDNQSVLEAFKEETSMIGSDVSIHSRCVWRWLTRGQKAYRVRERPVVKSSYDQIRHNRAGDIDEGKAWRSVRRPSDIVGSTLSDTRALANGCRTSTLPSCGRSGIASRRPRRPGQSLSRYSASRVSRSLFPTKRPTSASRSITGSTTSVRRTQSSPTVQESTRSSRCESTPARRADPLLTRQGRAPQL